MTITGTCDERFEGVRAAFRENFDAGRDIGASVAVTYDGESVVDLWGGTVTTDTVEEAPWERDTIINVWSLTKTMAALSCLVLEDQGELDLDAPISGVWPEFAAGGKRGITTTHVLSHTAGLSGWAEPMTTDDLYDWDKAVGVLARQGPMWTPGTASGYHAVTQGFLLGEVVRRVTGQTLGEFFANEIGASIAADFHIGTPAEHDSRVAHVIPPPTIPLHLLDPDSIAFRTLGNPALDATASATIPWRRAEIPAVNGHGNARSVAQVHSFIANEGEAGGIRLLSATACNRIFDEQIHGQDLVLPVVLRLGVGFGLTSPEVAIGPNRRTCFWGGWGGSLAVIDLDARMSFAYVMNRMGEGTIGDERAFGMLLAAYSAIGA